MVVTGVICFEIKGACLATGSVKFYLAEIRPTWVWTVISQGTGNPMNQWVLILQGRLLNLLDNLLEKLFDYGEPSLSDVVTQALESQCREH